VIPVVGKAASFTGLGDLTGGNFSSQAFGTSADGSVVVGFGISGSGPEAFLWDSPNGMRNLEDVLTSDYGLGNSLTGWRLDRATGISPDGLTIVGYGINPSGDTEAWRAQLTPVPVPAAIWLFGSGLAALVGLARRRMTS
jgi:uncharacterized membrane protein